MNTPTSVAERIKLIRNDQSYAKFAREINCNINTLRSYERGLSNPNFEFIQSVCTVKNISASWLIFGTGTMLSVDSQPMIASAFEPATAPQTNMSVCGRCAKLDAELEQERMERRELSLENRKLWKENGNLREEVATLRERQKGGHSNT